MSANSSVTSQTSAPINPSSEILSVRENFLKCSKPPTRPETFSERVEILLSRGVPIIPLQPRSKEPSTPHAAYDGTSDSVVIAGWTKRYPANNVGAVARYDGFWMLDDDLGTLAEKYRSDTGEDFPQTFTVQTARGFHYYFRHTQESRLVRYGGHENSGVIEIPGHKGEARCNHQYVVGPESIHPSDARYTVSDDSEIVAAPAELLAWLRAAYQMSESLKPESEKPKGASKADPGFRKLFDAVGYGPLLKRINSLDDTRLHVTRLTRGDTVPCPMPNHKHGDFSDCFGSIKNAPELLHCLGKCQWTGDMVSAVYQLDGGKTKYKNMYDCARAICNEEGLNFEEFFAPKPDSGEPDAESKEGAEVHGEASESGDALKPSTAIDDSAPKLSDDALYGLAGDIVRKIMPNTESHPAGLLVHTLMYFGNIIGRTAYYQVESTRHYGNLFSVLVGVSSKARKGTGADRIDAVFNDADRQWFDTRRRSGLSSGEGLIVAVQNAVFGEDKASRPIVIEPEAHDKRLMVFEGEFGQVLAVMQRQGATISTNLRNAWDGKPLQTMTIRPRTATDHTISILGDITAPELKSMLTQQDSTNGFANRFLWVHVERTKLLPFGGDDLDFAPEAERLRQAVEFATQQRRVFLDRNAREMWSRAYERLSVDHGGLFGAVTSRGEAQVIRLALLYAVMDRSQHIQSKHLQAALSLWQYCEDSARYIFDALTANQQLILEWLRDEGPKTKTELLNFFGRNRRAADIQSDVDALTRRHLIGITKAYPRRYHVWGTTNQAEKSS